MTLLAALNWHSLAFLLFALIACGFGVAVLATNNVVRMAFYLTLSLGATAGLFFLAGAEFVGSMQLMIYVGGTLVLLIFGVMLTAQAKFISMQTSAGELILGAIVGSTLLLLLLRAGMGVESWRTPRPDQDQLALADGKTSTPIGLALAGVRVDKLSEPSERLRGGMSGYLLPFVIISMHLLVVLIGAGYMARTKRAASGLAVDRPAPAPALPNRKRSFLVAVGLVKGLIINLILAGACFWLVVSPLPIEGEHAPTNAVCKAVSHTLAESPNWMLPALGLLFLANALLIAVVWSWQKWGVVCLVAVPVVQTVVLSNAGLPASIVVGFLIVALLPVVVLIGLLSGGKQPTAWSQME